MRCAVIIPVGPGHEQIVGRAVASVEAAIERNPGNPFDRVDIEVVDDHNGFYGRSAARNIGMDRQAGAHWYFMLDADDVMDIKALGRVVVDSPATFGALSFVDGREARWNVYPVSRDTLFQQGPRGTLSMGFFVNARLGLRFNEKMDVGEDFDFYMRLPGFRKIKHPLVHIGSDTPSATGPRRGPKNEWLQHCEQVIDSYRPASVT